MYYQNSDYDRGQIRQTKITPLEPTWLELRTCMILMHSSFKHLVYFYVLTTPETVSIRVVESTQKYHP